MYKILSTGTSFNHGLGLHFYERYNNGLPLNYMLSEKERKINVDNSFHSILAKRLNVESEIYSGDNFGLDTAFDDLICGIKLEVEKEQPIPIKIVIIQLSTAEKDFFIYNNKVFRLNFNSPDEFLASKDKLIDSIDDSIKEDFIEKLELEFDKYFTNTALWREQHSIWFVDKLNELNDYLLQKGVTLKVISYYNDFNSVIDSFKENMFVTFLHNGIEFYNVKALVDDNKLRIKDDISITTDEHPNFKTHEIVANNIFDSLNISYL